MKPFTNLCLLPLWASLALSQSTIRYMPFGDSITEIVCWRSLLWSQLQQAGYTNINFVGSGTTDQCNGAGAAGYDKDNEGHTGFQAVNIASQNQLVGWLKQNPADIITMHLGTNDAFVGRSVADVVKAFGTLVDQMRASNPKMRIIIAQIIPLSVGSNSVINQINAAIPAFAQSKNSTESPIWVVDQNTGFTAADLRDGVHPNASGDKKMAAVWYPAVVAAIQSLGGANFTRASD